MRDRQARGPDGGLTSTMSRGENMDVTSLRALATVMEGGERTMFERAAVLREALDRSGSALVLEHEGRRVGDAATASSVLRLNGTDYADAERIDAVFGAPAGYRSVATFSIIDRLDAGPPTTLIARELDRMHPSIAGALQLAY